MGKFKAVRPKSDTPATPQMKAGVPCIIIVVVVFVLVMVVMYLAVTHAS